LPSEEEAEAVALVTGVSEHRADIEQAIRAAAENWTLERMPFVDRNVLRIATYELLFTEVAVGVVVNEAVTLAKLLSTEGSGRFVNGVLGRIARDARG
jgi:N utilization substance protein B